MTFLKDMCVCVSLEVMVHILKCLKQCLIRNVLMSYLELLVYFLKMLIHIQEGM